MTDLNTKSPLGGILPALVTPLDESLSVDVRSLEKLLDRVYTAGADGIYVCGSTGEGLLLPEVARRVVAEVAVKASPKDKLVIVHTGATTLDETVALTKEASSLGVAAVSSLPLPRSRPEDLVTFYSSVAAAANVPVLAYYFPSFTGFELSLDQLSEICSIPGVAGVKFTDYDLYTLSLLVKSGVTVFNGRDEVLAAGLLMGASGGIGSIYNLLAHRFTALFRMGLQKEWESARKLQFEINKVIRILLKYPLLPAIKQVLSWNGIECGRTVSAPGVLTATQQQQLQQDLKPFGELLAP